MAFFKKALKMAITGNLTQLWKWRTSLWVPVEEVERRLTQLLL